MFLIIAIVILAYNFLGADSSLVGPYLELEFSSHFCLAIFWSFHPDGYQAGFLGHT